MRLCPPDKYSIGYFMRNLVKTLHDELAIRLSEFSEREMRALAEAEEELQMPGTLLTQENYPAWILAN